MCVKGKEHLSSEASQASPARPSDKDGKLEIVRAA
jgi:hypothetical protein